MVRRILAAIRGNLVAWLALFVALGGTSLAASHYSINSIHQINPKVLNKLRGKVGKPGAPGAPGLAGAQGPVGAVGANGAQLAPGPLPTLPSHVSESGDYGAATETATLSDTVTFPVPLAKGIPPYSIVYVWQAESPVAHCPGPGQADPGFLCIYANAELLLETEVYGPKEEERYRPPDVADDEAGGHGYPTGTGAWGFRISWSTQYLLTRANPGVAAYDYGTYTVTAP